ncbi:MAG: bacteriocin [Proteobacteria bacterium]|nr:bacteriocin [Pseudomonadota bacterium]
MRKILAVAVVAALGLGLAGCETARQDRVAGGALIGAGTGALIGGLAGRSTGAAVAGGLIGAAAGAIIADETRPGRCYWRDRYGRRHYVRCR